MLQGEKIPFQTHGTALEKEATLGKEAISTPGSPCVMVGCPWAMFRRSTSDNGIGTNCMPDLNSSLPRNSKPVHIHCSFNTQYLWNSNRWCHTPTVSENNPQITELQRKVCMPWALAARRCLTSSSSLQHPPGTLQWSTPQKINQPSEILHVHNTKCLWTKLSAPTSIEKRPRTPFMLTLKGSF